MLRVHPVAAKCPVIDEDRYRAVFVDVRDNGQQVPIVLHEGMIWDGRARYDACFALGVVPWLVPLRRQSPVEFYVYANYARCASPSSPKRKAIVETLCGVFDAAHLAATAARRSLWMREARSEFQNFERAAPLPCAVCGSHLEFVHAHHSFPLALQFECGLEAAIHDHQWLCPVHHKKVHVLLSGYLLGAQDLAFLDSVPEEILGEWREIERVSQAGIDLCCDALGRVGNQRRDPPFGLYVARYQREMFPWPRDK